MSRAVVAVIAVVAVVACAGSFLYYLHGEHPEYTVEDTSFIDVEVLATASFTVVADLDETKTVTLWAGGERLMSGLSDEWTWEAGHHEETFAVLVPEGMDESGFFDALEVHFDGKAGWRR